MPTGLDPLSPATRAIKRNLLATSVLAITFKAFDVTIDKIPVAGLSISFDNRVFVFLLLISLSYFFAIFLLYYFIDIRNVEDTPRQIEGEKTFPLARARFAAEYEQDIFRKLSAKYPFMYFSCGGDTIANVLGVIELRDLEFGPIKRKWWWPEYLRNAKVKNFGRRVFIKNLYQDPKGADQLLNLQVKPGREHLFPQTFEDSKAFRQGVVRRIRKEMRRYRFRLESFKIEQRLRLKSMRIIYFMRNYLTDGILPIGLGLIAFGVLYEWIPVDWLRHIAPPK